MDTTEALNASLHEVTEKVREVEGEIENVDKEIKAATAMLMEKGGPGVQGAEVEYWRKKEEQLWKEKEQLRKKEEQLRKKEEQLRELLAHKLGGGKSTRV